MKTKNTHDLNIGIKSIDRQSVMYEKRLLKNLHQNIRKIEKNLHNFKFALYMLKYADQNSFYFKALFINAERLIKNKM